jgi:predicted ATPase
VIFLKVIMNELISPIRTKIQVREIEFLDILSPISESIRYKKLFIERISITGMLSFREKTNFDLGSLNVLVGPNGSGKSNLLDCVRICRNSSRDIQETFKESGFEEWIHKNSLAGSVGSIQTEVNIPGISEKVSHRLSLDLIKGSRVALEELIFKSSSEIEEERPFFIGSYKNQEALLSHDSSGSLSRRRVRRIGQSYNFSQSILSQIKDSEQYPQVTQLSNLYKEIKIYSDWSFGRKSTLRESAQIGGGASSLSEDMNDLPLVLNYLEDTQTHLEIRNYLKELKDTYIDYSTKIMFSRVGLEIIESAFESKIPASRLSDGTLRFIALAVIFLQEQLPPLICIEEPELGMHPDMIRMIANMIVVASRKTQVILTTHSEQLLTALENEFDAVFAFSVFKGSSYVRKFTRQDYKSWRNDHTLGELWTSGELGGNRW